MAQNVIADIKNMLNKQALQFHIKSNDYFGTHATVLDLYRQLFDGKGYSSEYSKKLRDIVEELMYLQKNHVIASKPKRERYRLSLLSACPKHGYACKGSLSPLPALSS